VQTAVAPLPGCPGVRATADPCGTHRSRLGRVLKPDNQVKAPSRRTPARGEAAEVDTSDQNAQTAPKGISMRSSHEVTPANKAERSSDGTCR